MPGLGRIRSPDPRDYAHPMRAHLPVPPARPVQVWMPGPASDQGDTPRCTAYAWKHWLTCSPWQRSTNEAPDTAGLYVAEQKIDGFAHGPLPDDSDASGGSSVRAGAKVLQAAGRIGEYVWAGDVPTIAHWVLERGPVVLGLDWYEGMFQPDLRGFVRPTGAVAGGHAFLCIGYSSFTGNFLFQNSWGTNWGAAGRWRGCFRMTGVDLASLLADQGEACGAVENSQ